MFNPQILRCFPAFSRKYSVLSPALREMIKADIPATPPYRANYDIVTLDPKKFAEKKQKRLCIADNNFFTPHVILREPLSSNIGSRLQYDYTMEKGIMTRVPFPSGTDAFLYYDRPPESPRIAGELRFRVASSDDPKSFASGFDLLRKGRPWSRSLYILAKYYPPLYQKLREEGFVPDDLDANISALPKRKLTGRHFLYSLNDTFIVDFSSRYSAFPVITEQGMETLELRHHLSDRRGEVVIIPYTGSALARFERSTIPEHKGTRTVVLRFLKMITPVQCLVPNYDGYIRKPNEEELYKRYIRRTSVVWDPPTWRVDIDRPRRGLSRALQLLWDA